MKDILKFVRALNIDSDQLKRELDQYEKDQRRANTQRNKSKRNR